jgi:hypothetical protein
LITILGQRKEVRDGKRLKIDRKSRELSGILKG